MKVGTITFHWATNYGAVLQAYALQQILIELKINTEIIDYRPRKLLIRNNFSNIKNLNIRQFIKEKNINKFRKNEMILSKKKYYTHKQLEKVGNFYEGVFTGSDQIWNEWFTLNGEGGKTLSYFLDFLPDNVKKFSYAASFGCVTTTEVYDSVVKKSLEKLDKISVRERTGIDIINSFGLDAKLVCDPTLLLTATQYSKLIKNKKANSIIFPYIINGNQEDTKKVYHYLINRFNDSEINLNFDFGIYDWLRYIRDSKFVVTNSFHGVVFCLLFNTPFIPVLIKGSGMNDRLITLLKIVGLENRIINEYDEDTVRSVVNKSINWNDVNKRVAIVRSNALNFISECIQDIG